MYSSRILSTNFKYEALRICPHRRQTLDLIPHYLYPYEHTR